MKIQKELIKRQIAGDTVLVPVGKAVYDANGLFILNDVGAFLWDLLPEKETPQQLVECLLEEYEVDAATAEADVNAFVQKLRSMGILA